jgi:hypothetical protein
LTRPDEAFLSLPEVKTEADLRMATARSAMLRKQFTLIELLVVIAMSDIQADILPPASRSCGTF